LSIYPPWIYLLVLLILAFYNLVQNFILFMLGLSCLTLLFEGKVGDRIVQLILEKIVTPHVMEVKDLDATVRGVGGFGSTGV
jgi:hypothetical protein